MEALGIVGAALEIAAIWLLGSKRRLGFLCNLGGNALWMAYVLLGGRAWGLLLVCPAAFILNVRGFRKWRK